MTVIDQSANVLSPGILILLPALYGTSIVPIVKPGTEPDLHNSFSESVVAVAIPVPAVAE